MGQSAGAAPGLPLVCPRNEKAGLVSAARSSPGRAHRQAGYESNGLPINTQPD